MQQNRWLLGVLLLIAAVIGTLRLFGHVVSPFFQAIAHLYVGGLYGAAMMQGTWRKNGFLVFAVALTLVEIIAFLLSRA